MRGIRRESDKAGRGKEEERGERESTENKKRERIILRGRGRQDRGIRFIKGSKEKGESREK